MPHLKPVGHQSTNWIVRLVLIVATEAFCFGLLLLLLLAFGWLFWWWVCGFVCELGGKAVSGDGKKKKRRRRNAKHIDILNDVLGHHVAAVHQAARHVLAVARVALGHHARGLERAVGDLGHGQLLVVRLLGADDGGCCCLF